MNNETAFADFDTMVREYAEARPELGALDDITESEDGVLYFFEYGTVLVTEAGEVAQL